MAACIARNRLDGGATLVDHFDGPQSFSVSDPAASDNLLLHKVGIRRRESSTRVGTQLGT